MTSWNAYLIHNLQKLEATDLFKASHHKLRENRWYKPVLDYVEELTKVNRVYSVTVLSVLLSVALLVQYGTALIIGCVGFVLPAYKTLEELEKPLPNSTRRWLMYWFLNAALSFYEMVFFFLPWMPGYWFLKSLFLYWCYAPLQRNGSEVIYDYFVSPFFQQNREAIVNVVDQVTRTAHSIYTDADPLARSQGHPHAN